MKVAVISDIHGNIYALMRALEAIEDERVDSIICLGDLVGYGPHPNEVVGMIRRKNILCIKGNYDASVVDGTFSYIRETKTNSFTLPWTCDEIRAENRHYLSTLPTSINLEIGGKNILFLHGSPNKINEYLIEDSDITSSVMSSISQDVLVCAHTHIPSVKKFENKLFVNVGSIGKPKIGRPNSTFAIIDIDDRGIVNATIKETTYEVKRIIKDMQMLNFPSELIRSFETGME